MVAHWHVWPKAKRSAQEPLTPLQKIFSHTCQTLPRNNVTVLSDTTIAGTSQNSFWLHSTDRSPRDKHTLTPWPTARSAMSTREPLRTAAARPQNAFPSNARIPLDYCDGPTQRIYAVSAFVFLQALKVYYCLGIGRSDYAAEFFGFILWLSLDVAFLMALNYLRIPWLELPVIRLIVAVFILTIVNYVLFTAREVCSDQTQQKHCRNGCRSGS